MYFPETARFDLQTPHRDPDWEDEVDYVWRTPAGQLLSPRDFQAHRDLPLQRVGPVKLFCTLPLLFILFILYKLWWNQGYWWSESGSLSPSTNFKIYNHSLIMYFFTYRQNQNRICSLTHHEHFTYYYSRPPWLWWRVTSLVSWSGRAVFSKKNKMTTSSFRLCQGPREVNGFE